MSGPTLNDRYDRASRRRRERFFAKYHKISVPESRAKEQQRMADEQRAYETRLATAICAFCQRPHATHHDGACPVTWYRRLVPAVA